MQGRIIKQVSNDYSVLLNNEIIVCKARGKFRKLGVSPLVGDMVLVDLKNKYILDILPRKNSLVRPAIANVDQAIVVTSVEVPEFSSNLLDKLLTIIEYNNIKPIIYFSKLDLIDSKKLEEINEIISYYRKIGYAVYTDFEDVKKVLKDKVTVLTGQSGAGKSTLLNKLDNSLNLKVDKVSYALGRGKHTTRHTEFLNMFGGYVADTPGFSSLNLSELKNEDIRDNFIEFNKYRINCEYDDCMHYQEDNCNIKKQVENKEILESRYLNYISFITKR